MLPERFFFAANEEGGVPETMRYRTFGVLAHVDAGKTTLSEALLYLSGAIRSAGRVDRGDTHLDTDTIERERGITIFSKQARFRNDDLEMILLDTPGHADFSAEMERVLQVLDCAVLVISGTDGVESHTRTLWRLFEHYRIPVLIFVNKMDLAGADRTAVMAELKKELSSECVDFDEEESVKLDEIAMTDDALLDALMQTGTVPDEMIREAVSGRRLFPVWFGSALKMEKLEGLMRGLALYTSSEKERDVKESGYSARVYKISRDSQGSRLTHLRVTGGTLRTHMPVNYTGSDGRERLEKIDQIRLYSGDRYEQVHEAGPGQVCAVTGLTESMPGCGLGDEPEGGLPVIEPVVRRTLILPPDVNPMSFYRKLLPLSEEEPSLHIVWNEKNHSVELQLMGEVQTDVLTRIIKDRLGVAASLGEGRIIYKETVVNAVEGIGHFEPLRHYAEVHLLIEPGDTGSGVTVCSGVSTDDLDLHWQRLIMTHLLEKEHTGVLTGSGLTDVKITLTAGRAHLKHTEGGDFRQAVYRAVRQGLMQADCALLEPYYSFVLMLPEDAVGRAMSDLSQMYADFSEPEYTGTGRAVLKGTVPVSCAGSYQTDVSAYTKGEGSLSLSLCGYRLCHNTEEVLEAVSYDPESDTDNPSSSVFCAHGAGVIIPWNEVASYAHLPCMEADRHEDAGRSGSSEYPSFRAHTGEREKAKPQGFPEEDEELRAIYAREFGMDKEGMRRDAEESGRRSWKKKQSGEPSFRQKYDKHGQPIYPEKDKREEHLIVDGYNMIFQWRELKELADLDIGAARGRLLDLLSNYQGYLGFPVTVVFDAYRTKKNPESVTRWQNLTVVFTKENETADAYIERMVHEENRKYRFTVATSDALEQLTVLRLGAVRMSANMLKEDMKRYSSGSLNPYSAK